MKNKKLMALGLVSIASVLTLAACGDEEKTDSKEEKKEKVTEKTTEKDKKSENTGSDSIYTLQNMIEYSMSNIGYLLPTLDLLKENEYFGAYGYYTGNYEKESLATLDYLKGLNDDDLSEDEVALKNALIEIGEVESKIFNLMDANFDSNNQTFTDDEASYDQYNALREEIKFLYEKHIDTLITNYYAFAFEDLAKEDIPAYFEFTAHFFDFNVINDFEEDETDEYKIIDAMTFEENYNELSMVFQDIEPDEMTLYKVESFIKKLENEKSTNLYKNNKFYKEYIDDFNAKVINEIYSLIKDDNYIDARTKYIQEINTVIQNKYFGEDTFLDKTGETVPVLSLIKNKKIDEFYSSFY